MLLFLSSATASSATSVLLRRQFHHHLRLSTMSATNLQPHSFAGNPIRAKTPKPSDPFSPNSSLQTLKSHLLANPKDPISPTFKILPFREGRPLVGSDSSYSAGFSPHWHLGWLSLADYRCLSTDSEVKLREEKLVFLGARSEEDLVYWAIDVSEDDKLVDELGKKHFSFVELRTLMKATDWADPRIMGELAVAGHARALLEWHSLSRFCGHCGSNTVPMEAGRRMQCTNESCKKRIYPRIDPVVIMLVIDRENDRALLSRKSRYVPRMWSCLAGFIEPGESLEEAVRRETWEETGIEVGEVVYHSSQPWPVGPSSMPCQLMVGFFAYAKSLEINVDKDELEDAQWQNKEDVKNALSLAEYEKAQRSAAAKVEQICKGVAHSFIHPSDFIAESGEVAPLFVPGPYAIAHHLISTWAFEGAVSGSEPRPKQAYSSLSNL